VEKTKRKKAKSEKKKEKRDEGEEGEKRVFFKKKLLLSIKPYILYSHNILPRHS